MRIAFLMRRHPPTRLSPIMPQVVSLLTEWGAEVDQLYPDDGYVDLGRVRAQHDLYVLRSNSDLALSLAWNGAHRGATGGGVSAPGHAVLWQFRLRGGVARERAIGHAGGLEDALREQLRHGGAAHLPQCACEQQSVGV